MRQKKKISKVAFVFFVLISLLGLALRWTGKDVVSGDWRQSLSVWIEGLDRGGLKALASYEGNYNMPYVTFLLAITYLPINPLYAVKAFSVIFDYVCAFSGGVLAVMSAANKERKAVTFLLTYGLILCSPCAIYNSMYWSQCDSIYVSFILLAVIFLLKEKYSLSMIFWGFAFAFKLQAVFAMPILLIYYWKNRKFSALQFLWIPLVNEILCIPAIIGGCSPLITLHTYLGQTETTEVMYNFYPNFWGIMIDAQHWVFFNAAVVGTVGLLAVLAVLIVRREKVLDCSNFLYYFAWLVMSVLFFLPSMHERYGYLLEMITISLFVIDKKKWYLPVILQGITLVFYRGYFNANAQLLGCIYLVAYLMLSFEMMKRLVRGGGEYA